MSRKSSQSSSKLRSPISGSTGIGSGSEYKMSDVGFAGVEGARNRSFAAKNESNRTSLPNHSTPY